MRSPTLDQMVDTFTSSWKADDPDPIRSAMMVVRDLFVVGQSRARVRRQVRERPRRRRGPARSFRNLIATYRPLVERVARAGGFNLAALLADDHSRTVSRWRFVAMLVLDRRELSCTEIAAVMNRSSHQPVLRGIREANKLVAADPQLAETVRRLAA